MNILHINQSDIAGGAAIAGYRLHQGLLAQNINSKLLVGRVTIKDNSSIAAIPRKPRLDNRLRRLTQPLGFNYINFVGAFAIPQNIFYQEADIINLHNLHSGAFNYLALPRITKHKPTVFTLHDMWSFTGHCAYSYNCDRWKIGCGKCPHLESYPAVKRDNTAIEWKLKNWIYDRTNLTIVTLSSWLTEQVKQSMLARFPIQQIPNGIDTQAYQPIESDKCRDILGIPQNKKVLLFAAQNLQNYTKGGDLLVKALSCLPESLKQETILLTIGKDDGTIAATVGLEILNLGYINDDHQKSVAYSAADLFILPTRADNLPLVLQESMACGTPMISFKVGGVSDLVRPEITGYLAQPEDAQDLAKGIVKLLEDQSLREKMSQNCRAIAIKEYSLELQVKRYLNLYHQVLIK
jgi:glycosyltransferase involved in cell wall biosynthesis